MTTNKPEVFTFNSLSEECVRLSDYEARMAVLFDGHAVYSAMTDKAKQHTSYESVAAVLDAVVKLMGEVKHDNQ